VYGFTDYYAVEESTRPLNYDFTQSKDEIVQLGFSPILDVTRKYFIQDGKVTLADGRTYAMILDENTGRISLTEQGASGRPALTSSQPGFQLIELGADTEAGNARPNQLLSSRLEKTAIRDGLGLLHSFIRTMDGSYEVIERLDGVFEFHLNQAVDVEQYLQAQGITDAALAAQLRDRIKEELEKSLVTFSDVETGTVTLGGIRYRISKHAQSGEVELTGRDTRPKPEGELHDPLLKQKLDVTSWKNPDNTYSFFVAKYGKVYVSDPETKTVVFDNFVKYDVTEDGGRISLTESTRTIAAPPFSQIMEVYGRNYGVVKNTDGTYSFYDGLYTYKSDAQGQSVRLGEFVRATYDEYYERLANGTLNEVKGILYDIHADAETGKIYLTDHKEPTTKTQIIELKDRYYTVGRDLKGNITFSDPETGELMLTIPASTSELVFGEENYDITRDPSTGWIHFKSKLSGIESRDVQLLSINGVRYRAEKFSASEYRFAGLNRVFVSSATTGTVKLADDHDYMIQVDANGRIKLTQVYINEFSRDQMSIILGTHIYEVERISDTLLNFRDEAGQIVQSGISGTVTLHGKSYEVIIHEDGVVTLAGDEEISSSLSRKLITIGDTIYVVRQEKDGRFSFTHDEDVAYSSLTNLLDLNRNKIFQLSYDQATGKLHVWERDHVESRPVELLEIKMPSTTRRVTFAGKTYEFDYNVIDMVENTLTGDKHMQRPLFRFTQQDDATFENRTYKFQGSAMACHNSDCDSYDILSTDRNQYTIDLPEATLRLDTYPRVYAYAVMVDGRLFYMYERSTKDHSFYSEGTYYNSWTENCGEKCVREYVQLPDGKGGAVKMEIHYGPRSYYDEGAANADYFGTRVKMDVVNKGGAANVQVMPQLEISTDVV
ncbi:MAG: hypothetical protein HYZ83_04185, partial [Candidatus Omnitrophica bacterium]|nr:hypothetical protein [Candidatus Omnitrophota bacterium]